MGEAKKVLVVDDDRLIVQMLEDLFRTDFDVVTANNGAKAMELLQQHSFDAVLCDQMMPQVKGVDVLRECMSRQPRAVRILVTATERVQDVRDAVNLARVHRVVVKPFRLLEVAGVVKGAIHEAQLERENELLVEELQQVLEQVRKREIELENELKIRTQELRDVMAHLLSKGSGSTSDGPAK